VYWTTLRSVRSGCCRTLKAGIARARRDGSDLDRHLIPEVPIIFSVLYHLEIAVDGRHIYWTDSGGGHIGRARLDGTHIEEAFIRNASGPTDVAVAGGHVYWTNPQQRLLSILGSRLKLRRDLRTSTKLACPTLFPLPSDPSPPCVGTLRLLTADPVRYLGDKRRVTLATARYTITEGKRQTLHLGLSERKAALVRSNPRTRRVRAVAEVERTPGDRAIVSEPMTMILAH
jgi:Low-density lipoprotein receptor repeat class B